MAKNDYFVIAHRILAYLYFCLKNGEIPNINKVSNEKLEINKRYWTNILIMLYNEGYINGISVFYICGEKDIKILDIGITQKGIVFLQENSSMAKAKEFLKSLKDIIPEI